MVLSRYRPLIVFLAAATACAGSEVLRLVPQSQREAAHALGMSKWRTTVGVVLPACLSGILTGTRCSRSRALPARPRAASALVVLQPRPAGDVQPVRTGDPENPDGDFERLRGARCRESRARL